MSASVGGSVDHLRMRSRGCAQVKGLSDDANGMAVVAARETQFDGSAGGGGGHRFFE
jgi:hypothetical protein